MPSQPALTSVDLGVHDQSVSGPDRWRLVRYRAGASRCSAFGSTPKEALREVGVVLQAVQELTPRVQPAIWPEDAGDG